MSKFGSIAAGLLLGLAIEKRDVAPMQSLSDNPHASITTIIQQAIAQARNASGQIPKGSSSAKPNSTSAQVTRKKSVPPQSQPTVAPKPAPVSLSPTSESSTPSPEKNGNDEFPLGKTALGLSGLVLLAGFLYSFRKNILSVKSEAKERLHNPPSSTVSLPPQDHRVPVVVPPQFSLPFSEASSQVPSSVLPLSEIETYSPPEGVRFMQVIDVGEELEASLTAMLQNEEETIKATPIATFRPKLDSNGNDGVLGWSEVASAYISPSIKVFRTSLTQVQVLESLKKFPSQKNSEFARKVSKNPARIIGQKFRVGNDPEMEFEASGFTAANLDIKMGSNFFPAKKRRMITYIVSTDGSVTIQEFITYVAAGKQEKDKKFTSTGATDTSYDDSDQLFHITFSHAESPIVIGKANTPETLAQEHETQLQKLESEMNSFLSADFQSSDYLPDPKNEGDLIITLKLPTVSLQDVLEAFNKSQGNVKFCKPNRQQGCNKDYKLKIECSNDSILISRLNHCNLLSITRTNSSNLKKV